MPVSPRNSYKFLLGHKSIETTNAHYAPFALSRARTLDESVGRMHALEETPLQMVDSYYRADKFRYSVHLVRVQDKGKWSWSQKVINEPALR